MNRVLKKILKAVVPIGLVVWLLWRTYQSESNAFEELASGTKNWWKISFAFVVLFSAITLSFCRWYVLIRALRIPASLTDVLRLGFVSYLLSFVAPGQFGGDLFKAVFIAREQKERRMEAVATIFIDRVCGLYGLLLVATFGLLLSGFATKNDVVAVIATTTYSCTAIATLGLAAMMTPRFTNSWLFRWLERLPKVGRIVERLFFSLKLYQSQPWELFKVGVLSILVHLLIGAGIFLAADGVFQNVPTLSEHLVVSPLAGVVGSIPLTPGGLGSYEMAMDYLYDVVDAPNKHRGVVVGLMFRLSTICTALVGMAFYFKKRSEVEEIVKSVESENKQADSTHNVSLANK